jgi:hypothetical protein
VTPAREISALHSLVLRAEPKQDPADGERPRGWDELDPDIFGMDCHAVFQISPVDRPISNSRHAAQRPTPGQRLQELVALLLRHQAGDRTPSKHHQAICGNEFPTVLVVRITRNYCVVVAWPATVAESLLFLASASRNHTAMSRSSERAKEPRPASAWLALARKHFGDTPNSDLKILLKCAASASPQRAAIALTGM